VSTQKETDQSLDPGYMDGIRYPASTDTESTLKVLISIALLQETEVEEMLTLADVFAGAWWSTNGWPGITLSATGSPLGN
jgi:hypothetical protein